MEGAHSMLCAVWMHKKVIPNFVVKSDLSIQVRFLGHLCTGVHIHNFCMVRKGGLFVSTSGYKQRDSLFKASSTHG